MGMPQMPNPYWAGRANMPGISTPNCFPPARCSSTKEHMRSMHCQPWSIHGSRKCAITEACPASNKRAKEDFDGGENEGGGRP